MTFTRDFTRWRERAGRVEGRAEGLAAGVQGDPLRRQDHDDAPESQGQRQDDARVEPLLAHEGRQGRDEDRTGVAEQLGHCDLRHVESREEEEPVHGEQHALPADGEQLAAG